MARDHSWRTGNSAADRVILKSHVEPLSPYTLIGVDSCWRRSNHSENQQRRTGKSVSCTTDSRVCLLYDGLPSPSRKREVHTGRQCPHPPGARPVLPLQPFRKRLSRWSTSTQGGAAHVGAKNQQRRTRKSVVRKAKGPGSPAIEDGMQRRTRKSVVRALRLTRGAGRRRGLG